jgi:hypothetical protein
MHEIIASFDYLMEEIPPACSNVFYLGVKVIEKEYKTDIHCNLNINKHRNKAELHLVNIPIQHWYGDTQLRDTIVYKLSTHLKICLDQFDVSTTIPS